MRRQAGSRHHLGRVTSSMLAVHQFRLSSRTSHSLCTPARQSALGSLKAPDPATIGASPRLLGCPVPDPPYSKPSRPTVSTTFEPARPSLAPRAQAITFPRRTSKWPRSRNGRRSAERNPARRWCRICALVSLNRCAELVVMSRAAPSVQNALQPVRSVSPQVRARPHSMAVTQRAQEDTEGKAHANVGQAPAQHSSLRSPVGV